ncbi:type I-E CRISPR-associated protein Cas5/CasD [Pseudoalteromonas sp. S16_S37]|uniref:type I-E CRISPR-associated protein Cas5/CasD n=1 Tax=Pseudoalteromonas sp. S16_S37 TaxID=2720228 RepID=UPI0016810CE3|nr:type I-E CRISPR-associated protein Cas5/CasD [Pseudoalteromonas sp. S16_S37]MBD1581974.1 type I-E CRISPR-associated protein Cas5/CasD [Pseudoalteromonas sp. S16_S37]
MKTSNYLVFRLYGPLASWGDAAVGGDRPTHVRPTRGALLGLVAAALGIKREDKAELTALNEALSCHVKQYNVGSLLRDFHTAQVPSEDKKTQLYTRRDELYKSKKVNTVLSNRDYRESGLWVVALESRSSQYSLDVIRSALLRPKYMLYLGRKSCPLAAPLCPTLVENVSLKAALDHEFPPILGTEQADSIWLKPDKTVSYYWQGGREDLLPEHAERVHTQSVRDNPIDRKEWLFELRTEHQLVVEYQR